MLGVRAGMIILSPSAATWGRPKGGVLGQLHLREIERVVPCTGVNAASLRIYQHEFTPVLVTFEVLHSNETPEGAAGDRRRTTPER